jgi:hypothetical protein
LICGASTVAGNDAARRGMGQESPRRLAIAAAIEAEVRIDQHHLAAPRRQAER